jgi:hypothetical protein
MYDALGRPVNHLGQVMQLQTALWLMWPWVNPALKSWAESWALYGPWAMFHPDLI